MNRVINQLTIANGQTLSNIQQVATGETLGLIAPATMPEALTINVSHDGVTFAKLHDGSADVTGPAAGKARTYLGFPYKYIQLVAGGAVGAQRVIQLLMSEGD